VLLALSTLIFLFSLFLSLRRLTVLLLLPHSLLVAYACVCERMCVNARVCVFLRSEHTIRKRTLPQTRQIRVNPSSSPGESLQSVIVVVLFCPVSMNALTTAHCHTPTHSTCALHVDAALKMVGYFGGAGVLVKRKRWIDELVECGGYGKGIFSRSVPTFVQQHQQEQTEITQRHSVPTPGTETEMPFHYKSATLRSLPAPHLTNGKRGQFDLALCVCVLCVWDVRERESESVCVFM
jgi:hypothetical protein